jgi:hypothetical protein
VVSRSELVECCIELGLDWQGLSIAEMKDAVRKAADKKLQSKRRKHSADELSESLKNFLTAEYNYKIKDREGKVVKKYVVKNRRNFRDEDAYPQDI